MSVVIQGIKKQIGQFSPSEIVNNDNLLSGFSSCDAKIIIYLSFYNLMEQNLYEFNELLIEKQFFQNGETIFQLRKAESNESLLPISAKELYKNYTLLTKLGKKDMVNVISTAVQEQTIFDINLMQ